MNECLICNGTGRSVRRLGKRGAQFTSCKACEGAGFLDEDTAKSLRQALEGASNEKVVEVEKNNMALQAFQKVGKKAGQAITNSAQRKLAAATCNKLCEIGTDALGERVPFLTTPAGQKSLKVGLPIALMLGCAMLEEVEGNPVPANVMAGLSSAGELAFEGITEETMEEVLNVAMPFLTQIAQLGWSAMQMSAPQAEQLAASVEAE